MQILMKNSPFHVFQNNIWPPLALLFYEGNENRGLQTAETQNPNAKQEEAN